MVMGMQRPLVSRLEGKADNHQVGGMGQDGADRVAHLNTPGSHSDRAGMYVTISRTIKPAA